MYLTTALLILVFLLFFGMGYRQIICLHHLSRRRVITGFISVIIIFSLISIGEWTEIISDSFAATFTMLLYCLVAGFFCGFALKMIVLRQKLKKSAYIFRSFWTEAAPNFISILLIAFGIYQTGILTFGPYTGIDISSGLSLLGFGFFGLTVKIVPEFYQKGVLIIDQFVSWEKVIAYKWISEEVLQIDYLTAENKLTDFNTYIPPEDQLLIERLLGKKLKEHEKERKEMMERIDEKKAS